MNQNDIGNKWTLKLAITSCGIKQQVKNFTCWLLKLGLRWPLNKECSELLKVLCLFSLFLLCCPHGGCCTCTQRSLGCYKYFYYHNLP